MGADPGDERFHIRTDGATRCNLSARTCVGGGFGGLEAVKMLARAQADVTLIDRNNYHLFQPLSYQVAAGSLSPGEIAVPLRQIFRRERRVRVLLGEVTGFDLERREVSIDPAIARTARRAMPYDTLLVAGGSSYACFGHDEWRSLALEVKSLASALRSAAGFSMRSRPPSCRTTLRRKRAG